ncbi:atp-binding cassette sub-family c [Holotrichia oblita]|uniref:Atp-binding cassette sub-family c n=1 Tax=Holotrichia oblita TaxID=644536 RepID=A0ACB9TH45_HOLOL|nr:atp-binding cassette sub-family c [Holotrichia oblita]
MLKLSQKSLNEATAGKVVNLLANDVQRFDFAATALHHFWVTPLVVATITYLLWREVAISSLAGILSMLVLTLPIQALLGQQTSKFRQKVASRTDIRVRLMNEVVSGIQVIKMYAWEKPFERVIKAARLDEIKVIKVANYIRGIFLSWTVFMERTTLAVTLITFVLTDNILTSDIVFASQQYFNLLQAALAVFLPNAIQMGAESLVSMRRLKEFLLLEERPSSNIHKTNDKTIDVTNVDAKWTDEAITLKKINFSVPAGKLCAIIGPVGSGKSSILQALLGELPINSGMIKLGGKISYASQESWLFGSTVRGNILFGEEFKEKLYDQVVRACALERDFEQFPDNDQTLVGERGVSLSGGQRARINLARAIYKQADIYLLDDPLSAVDAHVGKWLFEECIMGYLGGQTRILVTHQLQYLKKADLIIVLNNGKIEAQGTFDELSKSSVSYTKLLIAADETTEKDKDVKESDDQLPSKSHRVENDQNHSEEEEKIIPRDSSAFTDYIISAGNIIILFLVCLILLFSQSACSGADYWISYWTEQEEIRHSEVIIGPNNLVFHTTTHVPSKSHTTSNNFSKTNALKYDQDELIDTYFAIYVYAGLIAAMIIFAILRSYLFFRSTSKASKNLHERMFNCLLKAPMRFFDTNPSGRVLNRFSKDIGAMDEILPRVLNEAIQTVLVMVGCLVMISVANYWMIIVIFVLAVVFAILRKWFLATAKSIKYLEAMGSVISGAMVGLAVSQAIGLTGMVQYGMTQIAEVVNQMTSVERILQYTILEQEGPFDTPKENQPSSDWPIKGNIEFKSVYLRYDLKNEPILKNLNINIKSGEKIGIVGRTGAGKSSLTSALFRLAPLDGDIIIDSLNTMNLGLHDVRSKISIIPQEPVLFSASMRYNLDPFNEYSDKDIWNALNQVELKNMLSSLEYKVEEGGNNFSVGQRQLICLARAIIRRNKILVLDEATANVDPETDNLIQRTIRNKFRDCTVLTIAHRLNTIMDSDRIIVMDAGRIVECDHPHLLLQNENGYFTKLVMETGDTMFHSLKKIAQDAYSY